MATLFEEIEVYLRQQKPVIQPGEQIIGHYQPDLVLQADQDAPAPLEDTSELQQGHNPRIALQGESAHWHPTKPMRYDPPTYQAQGVEPPIELEQDPLAFFRGLVHLLEFCAPFMVIVGAVVIIWAVGR